MSQLVDVERPGRGPGTSADAQPRVPGLEEALVVELYFEVWDARWKRLADENVVLKRRNENVT